MKQTLILLALMLAPTASFAADKRPALKVHVFTKTDPSGFADAAQSDRQALIARFPKELIRRRMAKTFVPVDIPEDADIRLEVLGVSTAEQENGLAILANGLQPNRPQRSERDLVTYRTVRLTFRDYQTDLRVKNGTVWEMVSELQRWVKLNEQKVFAR